MIESRTETADNPLTETQGAMATAGSMGAHLTETKGIMPTAGMVNVPMTESPAEEMIAPSQTAGTASVPMTGTSEIIPAAGTASVHTIESPAGKRPISILNISMMSVPLTGASGITAAAVTVNVPMTGNPAGDPTDHMTSGAAATAGMASVHMTEIPATAEIVNAENTEMELPNIIMGRNPVKEAIKSGRSIDRILVVKEHDGSLGEIVTLAHEANLVIREVERAKLDEICMPFE